MNEELKQLAFEAGCHLDKYGDICVFSCHTATTCIEDELEKFAKLVAAKERETITDEYWSCIQSDLEHGVKSLSEKAAKNFSTSMPELSKFGSWLEARGEA